MKNRSNTFVFESFMFEASTKTLTLKYSFDSEIFFEEVFVFNFDFCPDYSAEALEKAFEGLWIMAGISYFKAALPPEINFINHKITTSQKTFFEKIYRHGLGEFFYENNLDPCQKIDFPSDHTLSKNSVHLPDLSGNIVPLGGGKDSLTTVHLLNQSHVDFSTWTVGNYDFGNMIEKIGKPHLSISRKISPQLLKWNQEGALNGHIPISSILAFLSVCTAILTGKKNICLSNESSANEATALYKGIEINHQYSKSLEFEKDFQNYVSTFISPDIEYFSFLRPLTELKIAEIFCQNMLEPYFSDFASCNANFKISNTDKKLNWCGKCPKCAFVFAIFAPFVDKKRLCDLFGDNLFENPALSETFFQLMGLREHKPFECVGSVQEVQKSLVLSAKNFPEVSKFVSQLHLTQIQALEMFNYSALHPHSMPDSFFKNLSKCTSTN